MLKRIRTFAVGLSVGAGLGAVASILLAPDSGENMREQARQKYQQILLESAEAAEEKRRELRSQLENLTDAPSEKRPKDT